MDAARRRLASRVRETPLLAASETLAERCGATVRLKAESLQVTGSFKVRPALNGLLEHLDAARRHGVVASSSGNFAAAAAWAARSLGVAATIVMSRGSSPYKIERTEALGARVVLCDDDYSARQPAVDRLREETGAVEIHPHSSPETVAGDATCGLEILAALPDLGTLLVPASGGGLLAGCALALRLEGSAAHVVGVQPAGANALVQSFQRGERVRIPEVRTIADGIQASMPGELGFALTRRWVDEMIEVTDDEIVDAMRHLATESKLWVEPSGAVAVAALLRGGERRWRAPVVAVLTGGNVAPARWARLAGAV